MLTSPKSKSNINFILLIVAIFHWGITSVFTDWFFLKKSSYHAIAKLIVIIVFWQIIAYMIKRYKAEKEFRVYLHYVSIYFLFSFVFLILIWPGNWIWDDLLLLARCQLSENYPWYHFLTQGFFMAALFIFPTPVSIIILQLACISMIVGYFVYAISTMLPNKSKLKFLLYIPFILPAVLVMNNTGLRSTLFAYLILFFAIYILFVRWQGKSVKSSQIVFLCCITSIFITLRGEAIVYLFMAPLIFIVAFWSLTQRKQKILYVFLSIGLVFSISHIQNSLFGEKASTNYQLTLYIDPLAHLIKEAKDHNDHELILEVEKLLDTKHFEQSDLPANKVFFAKPVVRDTFYENHTNSKKLFSLYIELIKKYPDAFLKQRWDRFKGSFDPGVAKDQVGYNNMETAQYFYDNMFKATYVSAYIDRELRTKTLGLLQININPSFLHFVSNLILPFFILMGMLAFSLIQKQWLWSLMTLSIMSMYGTVFLGAPDSFFMYYFSFYLCAYAFVGVAIVYFLQNNAHPKTQKRQQNE